ncbi:hypothetical protein LEWO105114_07990 [Legionella worsleiensis]|nr:Uncharacterised protein [Legionella worsleiensis]
MALNPRSVFEITVDSATTQNEEVNNECISE